MTVTGVVERFAVLDPATGEEIRTVPDAGPEQGLAALADAHAAQADWAASTPQKRHDVLMRAHGLLESRSEEIARLITTEMGKTLADSRAEVRYAGDYLIWFAGEALRIGGRTSRTPDGQGLLATVPGPVGPCLLITPWNFPLAMGARKIAPAIAAGCTMVLKPAAQTPLTMLLLQDLLAEAGLPDGVLRVVTTTRADDVVRPLLADPLLRKVSFTGSTAVGRHLLRLSADRILRTSMELGGNAPFLVFADADVDAALDGAMQAKMRNGGQACTAANRFLVHADVAEEFTAGLVTRMSALRVGPGLQPTSDVGPVIDRRALEGIAALVDGAVEDGAQVLTGGADDLDEGNAGTFYPPTVLGGVPADARILQEEIFGPVAPVCTFADDDEAIALANGTPYGLAAYAYTRDVDRAAALPRVLDVGLLGLNRGTVSSAVAPFGGVKESGLGREGGSEGIEEYLAMTCVVSLDG